MAMFEPTRISVIKSGWLTTVQDTGRYGYQQYGVPVCGAMDRYAFVIANRLVGNRDHEAALEITLKGPELLFRTEAVIAVTGADLSPSVDGAAISTWTSVTVRAGGRLAFGARRAGARCYVAVAGGIDVPAVLGSRSTHIPSRTGGVDGRALITGDELGRGIVQAGSRVALGQGLPDSLRPSYSSAVTLRILPGPRADRFPERTLDLLAGGTYRLSGRSDRMGYRLEGPRLADAEAGPHISDGTATGALQVPPDGQPILLMADRQTTGGYPIIAVVISADLHLAGQLLLGDTVRFRPATLPEARAALVNLWQGLALVLPPHDRQSG
jgi:antagonist of KipI